MVPGKPILNDLSRRDRGRQDKPQTLRRSRVERVNLRPQWRMSVARRWARWISGTDSAMNKITWGEIGMAKEPGQYRYRFGFVTVTAHDIAIWQQYPNAVFTVIEPSVYAELRIFKLGTFELRDKPTWEEG